MSGTASGSGEKADSFLSGTFGKWLVGTLCALAVGVVIAIIVIASGSKPSRPAGQLGSPAETGHWQHGGAEKGGGSATNAPVPAPSPESVEQAEIEAGVVATLDRFGQSVVVRFGPDGKTGWVRHVSDSDVTPYNVRNGVELAVIHGEYRSGYAGRYEQWTLIPGATLKEMVVEMTRLGNRKKEVPR